MEQNNSKAIILALICTVIVSVAQILLKLGSTKFSLSIDQILNQFYNIPLLFGAGLYAIGAIVFIQAFRLGELSVVYPVMASGYILVTILSFYFLNETISMLDSVGLIAITTGVLFIGVSGKK
ncbi:MAG: EamA/RhaT family transporter [archaeon]|nr:EamA/RhaT family transporter [archaeon]